MKLGVLIGVIAAVFLSGCLEIPSHEILSSNNGTRLIERCPDIIPSVKPAGSGLKSTFHVTTWNLHKFQRANWQKELTVWLQRSDVLLLQETMGRPAFSQLLQKARLNWLQLQTFQVEGEATGVLAATANQALYACSLKDLEPVSRLPKSILLTLYPLENSHYPLLVANVHGINFELGMAAYIRQMTRVFQIANHYPGPVIVAGDFSSWGHRRVRYLSKLAQLNRFDEALPSPDLRVREISEPVDHIFYRKLTLRRTESRSTNTSSHNPLWAEFSTIPD